MLLVDLVLLLVNFFFKFYLFCLDCMKWILIGVVCMSLDVKLVDSWMSSFNRNSLVLACVVDQSEYF